MGDRKIIAVIMGHIMAEYTSDVLEGIIVQAKALGYNVAVFSLFSLSDELTPHQHGEENIYKLINFDKIAGVIFGDNFIWSSGVRNRVSEMLRKYAGGRVVCINSDGSCGFENIIHSEQKSFSAIVDHMIEVHGMKKICCLTGFKGNRIAEERLEGYINSMNAHNLEIKDEYLVYGDFWKESARRLAEDIAEGRIEKPEAVVCASDIMAISLCSALYEHGILVPDDIAVTGYDASYEAYENNPSVTTVSESMGHIGAECVCRLHKIISGEDVVPCVDEKTNIIRGLSCGCGKDIDYMMSYSSKVSAEREVNDRYQNSVMIENLTASNSLDECLTIIFENIYLLNSNIKQFVLCLDENWDRFSENDDEYIRDGYAKNMCVKMYYSPEKGFILNEKFSSADMFPPQLLEENNPVCCYFSPLHFGDRCLGYTVFKYGKDSECAGRIFCLWIKNINTALEYLRVKERMNVINNRMYISSIRDSLTGIYNRQGYKIFSKEAFAKSQKEHKKLLLIVADLDRLKYINDNFGHSEGDNAIITMAQAIQSCDGNGEKCFRTGGDEYAVLGCGDYGDDMEEYCRQRINGYLGRYNDTSGKEYDVEASIGIFLGYTDEYRNIEECYAIADKLMYDNKLARRKNRVN